MRLKIIILSAISVLGFTAPLFADPTLAEGDATAPPLVEGPEILSGLQIMRRVKDRADFDDISQDAVMVIERGGQKLTRHLKFKGKETDEGARTHIRFVEPADVRDTQYLTRAYDDPTLDDDMWIFLPTEGLIRRISGSGKKGSFMRSDFTNEDMEQQSVDDATHTLLREEKLGDRMTYVVESVPVEARRSDSLYGKRIIWVDQERWIYLRVDFYDKSGNLLKFLLTGGIEEINGIWTATKMVMQSQRRNSRTLVQYFDTAYDQGLDESLFDQSVLKR